MPGNVNIEFVNKATLVRLLAQAGPRAADAIGRGLYEEAAVIFAKSQAEVPHDTGVLMSSGQVHPPSIAGEDIVVEITYGGAASAYAKYQHETENLRHDPGRKDHYLEDPFDKAVSGFGDRLGDRVEAILRGLI